MISPRVMLVALPLFVFALAGCAAGGGTPNSGSSPDTDAPAAETTTVECLELSDGELVDSLPEFVGAVPTPDCIYSMQGGYVAIYMGTSDVTEVSSALAAGGWTDMGDSTFQKSEQTLAQVYTDADAAGSSIDAFEGPYVVLAAYSLD